MTLRDLLKKKEKIEANQEAGPVTVPTTDEPPIPEFRFIRTDTLNQEDIRPPHYPGDEALPSPHLTPTSPKKESRTRRLSHLLHRPKSHHADDSHHHHHADEQADGELSPTTGLDSPEKKEKRLSAMLHRHRKSEEASPANVPAGLPVAPPIVVAENDKAREAAAEARWEKRATLLVEGSSRSRSVSSAGSRVSADVLRPGVSRQVSDAAAAGDVNILEAISLHEQGDLQRSTAMFGHLADPAGPNNALAQVLYGLALRHGWGIPADASAGLTYLTYAASNSAAIESAALSAGNARGGAAKGELVLAIYELANSFRNGWGVARDLAAARQYYETAANLGDADAMEQAAWCYLEGVGGPKDRWKAAQFLRRAEEKGARLAGESWIWKDKYNADMGPGGSDGKVKKKAK